MITIVGWSSNDNEELLGSEDNTKAGYNIQIYKNGQEICQKIILKLA